MVKELKQELDESASFHASLPKLSRRSALEIRMDILRVIAEGAERPTQIMYKANLSWVLLCDQLDALAKSGFIKSEMKGARTKFSATSKGLALLESYLKLLVEARLR
jgi:predicted transcriptional regulator